eukprot:gene4683-5298_t
MTISKDNCEDITLEELENAAKFLNSIVSEVVARIESISMQQQREENSKLRSKKCLPVTSGLAEEGRRVHFASPVVSEMFENSMDMDTQDTIPMDSELEETLLQSLSPPAQTQTVCDNNPSRLKRTKSFYQLNSRFVEDSSDYFYSLEKVANDSQNEKNEDKASTAFDSLNSNDGQKKDKSSAVVSLRSSICDNEEKTYKIPKFSERIQSIQQGFDALFAKKNQAQKYNPNPTIDENKKTECMTKHQEAKKDLTLLINNEPNKNETDAWFARRTVRMKCLMKENDIDQLVPDAASNSIRGHPNPLLENTPNNLECCGVSTSDHDIGSTSNEFEKIDFSPISLEESQDSTVLNVQRQINSNHCQENDLQIVQSFSCQDSTQGEEKVDSLSNENRSELAMLLVEMSTNELEQNRAKITTSPDLSIFDADRGAPTMHKLSQNEDISQPLLQASPINNETAQDNSLFERMGPLLEKQAAEVSKPPLETASEIIVLKSCVKDDGVALKDIPPKEAKEMSSDTSRYEAQSRIVERCLVDEDSDQPLAQIIHSTPEDDFIECSKGFEVSDCEGLFGYWKQKDWVKAACEDDTEELGCSSDCVALQRDICQQDASISSNAEVKDETDKIKVSCVELGDMKRDKDEDLKIETSEDGSNSGSGSIKRICLNVDSSNDNCAKKKMCCEEKVVQEESTNITDVVQQGKDVKTNEINFHSADDQIVDAKPAFSTEVTEVEFYQDTKTSNVVEKILSTPDQTNVSMEIINESPCKRKAMKDADPSFSASDNRKAFHWPAARRRLFSDNGDRRDDTSSSEGTSIGNDERVVPSFEPSSSPSIANVGSFGTERTQAPPLSTTTPRKLRIGLSRRQHATSRLHPYWSAARIRADRQVVPDLGMAHRENEE